MKAMKLFHRESPGSVIPVVRTWWEQKTRSRDFATGDEVLFYYKFKEAMEMEFISPKEKDEEEKIKLIGESYIHSCFKFLSSN